MLSCREVADIIPAEDWSFGQRLQLQAHLLICSKCRALKRQYRVIDQGLRRLLHETPPLPAEVARAIADQWLESK